MATNERIRLGVLISGAGTNLQAIIDAIERGELKAEIAIVISNKANAPGLERASRHGLPTAVIDHRRFARREDFDAELVRVLKEHDVELVVCAGFMRILTHVLLSAFPNRVMNIHPSLLPAFTGIDAQRAAVEYGVRLAGCTVHFVTEKVDEGPIIIQAAVPVYPDDTEQTLRERILEQEHRIYPQAIALFQQGRLEIVGRKVRIKDFPISQKTVCLVNPPIDE